MAQRGGLRQELRLDRQVTAEQVAHTDIVAEVPGELGGEERLADAAVVGRPARAGGGDRLGDEELEAGVEDVPRRRPGEGRQIDVALRVARKRIPYAEARGIHEVEADGQLCTDRQADRLARLSGGSGKGGTGCDGGQEDGEDATCHRG